MLAQAIHQPSAGNGYALPTNTASEIAVTEWDANAYFHPNPHIYSSFVNQGQDVALSFAGTGSLLQYLHEGVGTAAKRFWRLRITEIPASSF